MTDRELAEALAARGTGRAELLRKCGEEVLRLRELLDTTAQHNMLLKRVDEHVVKAARAAALEEAAKVLERFLLKTTSPVMMPDQETEIARVVMKLGASIRALKDKP